MRILSATTMRLLCLMVVIFCMFRLIDGKSRRRLSSNSNDDELSSSLPSTNDEILDTEASTSVGVNGVKMPRAKTVSAKTLSRSGKLRRRKSKKLLKKNNPDNFGIENIRHDDIIRETMIQMFGFKHMPLKPSCKGRDCIKASGTDGDTLEEKVDVPPSTFKPNPPNFMLELYRTYSEERYVRSELHGNTVRSFFPSPANPRYREKNFGQAIAISPVPRNGPPTSVFLFNITLIPSTEDLVAAEIRLDGPLTGEQSQVMVGVYRKQSACDDLVDCSRNPTEVFVRVGRTLFLDSDSGMTWSNPKLAKLVKRARSIGHVIIVKFASDREDQNTTSLQRLRRHHEKSEGSIDLPLSFISHDAPETSMTKRSLDDDTEDSPTTASVTPMLIAYCDDSRTAAEAESLPAAPVIWKVLENITSTKRVRRSAQPISNPASTSDASPDDNKPREKRIRDLSLRAEEYVVEKRRRRKKTKNGIQVSRNETNAIEVQNRKQSRKNRKGKGNRRSGRKNKLHRGEKIGADGNQNLKASDEEKSCGRRSLPVSFADIGWSDWIISPENFEAYYCSGQCGLSQVRGSNATNHAIIQAVVKDITGHSHLPSPCCVPDKLLPLSVLFFDEDKNVVLKRFPNMSVDTCACR